MVQVERTGKKCTKGKGLILHHAICADRKNWTELELGRSGGGGHGKNRSQILSRALAEAEAEAKSPAPGEIMRKEGEGRGGGGKKKFGLVALRSWKGGNWLLCVRSRVRT